MRDLGDEHFRHLVRLGPHALADLAATGQARCKALIDIVVLIGAEPFGLPHGRLGNHGAGLHRGMNLVARAIEKAGIYERQPVLHRAHAGAQIDRGAPLLVHDADLDRMGRKAQCRFHPREQQVGKSDLGWAMHLGLDDIHAAGPRISQALDLLEIMQGRGDRHHGVEEPLRRLVLAGIEHRIGQHQMADIAHPASGCGPAG
jgi:hypothetical protein